MGKNRKSTARTHRSLGEAGVAEPSGQVVQYRRECRCATDRAGEDDVRSEHLQVLRHLQTCARSAGRAPKALEAINATAGNRAYNVRQEPRNAREFFMTAYLHRTQA